MLVLMGKEVRFSTRCSCSSACMVLGSQEMLISSITIPTLKEFHARNALQIASLFAWKNLIPKAVHFELKI